MATIQGIYIALFGRPADPLGLDFFNEATQDGADLSAIGDLSSQAEYLDRFEGFNNAQIVTAIYQSLFGRNPDAAGLAYFVAELNSGRQNINTIAINILDGAQGADAELVAAKEAAANQFTAAVAADPDALAAYQGSAGITFGQQFLDQVDSPDVEFTDAEVTAQVGAFGDGTEAPTNQINFTATVGEQLVGTAQNDAFNGVVDSGAAGTINVGDTVNGGGGTDTLNILVAGGTGLPAGFTSSSVEIVNVTYAGGTLGPLNSASFSGVQQLWQIDNTAGSDFQDVTVGAGVTAGFRSTGNTSAVSATSTVTAAAGVTSVAVALDGVLSGSAITLGETTTDGLSAVTVSGSVASTSAPAVNTLTIGATAGDVDTLNLSLSSNTAVTLGAGVNDLNTFNASGSTGNITIDLGTPDELASATFGSGSDTLTIGTGSLAVAGSLTINMGAGNDTIVLAGTGAATDNAVSITLGAGNDTVDINVLTNITTATAAGITADLITITDFSAAQDVLNVATLGTRDVLTNTELATIEGATDLAAAVTAAASVTAAGQYSVFNYGGDAYIYDNNGTAAFDAGDGLVRIVGFAAEDITAQNFVAA